MFAQQSVVEPQALVESGESHEAVPSENSRDDDDPIDSGARDADERYRLYLERMKDPVRLREIPDEPQDRSPISAELVENIERLIASLSEIDRPDYGFSSTMSGSAFLPVDDQHEFGAGIIMHHGLESFSALTQLVALGADALPFLLDSLSDQTPTGIVLEHRSGFGGMWFSREMGGHPLNPLEMDALSLDAAREPSRITSKSTP